MPKLLHYMTDYEPQCFYGGTTKAPITATKLKDGGFDEAKLGSGGSYAEKLPKGTPPIKNDPEKIFHLLRKNESLHTSGR